MDLFSVDIASVLVAALAAFVIGFLWHGPLFGKQWIRLMNIPQSEVDAMKAKGMGPMVPSMIAALLQQVVTAYVVALFAGIAGVVDAGAAMLLAFLLWLGFIATTLLNGVLWEKRTVNLYLFNVVYHLVSLIIIALIVALW